jgi:hypothetical protein
MLDFAQFSIDSTNSRAEGVEWLTTRIKVGETARMAKRERVSFHSLSRDEYLYSIYDLLGFHSDATDPGGFSDNPEWHGFERMSSVLSLSASHIDKYFQAAKRFLQRRIPTNRLSPWTFTIRPFRMCRNRTSRDSNPAACWTKSASIFAQD